MNCDLQNRAPTVTRTPDFRNHVERRFDVLNWVPKTPAQILAEAWLPLGSVDEEYTDCYLISQNVEGQNGDFYNPCKLPPVLVRVYEQLNGTAETQIGDPGVVMDQYGNQSVIIDYWQINLGTATYQVPGVTAAPSPFTACLLKTEERTNDGTLRKIRRTYIDNGYLSDTERLLFNGSLVIREITAIGFVPPTPSGWTLVTTSTEFVSGREVVRCGFANAGGGGGGGGTGGVVSQDTQYNISPDQGVTGVTVKTIQWVSNPSVVTNPIPSPGVGYVLIRSGYEDEAGYRLWSAVYAYGQGIISSEVESKEAGKLIIYRITAINAGTALMSPPTPAATIGGTVTLIDTNRRNGTDASDGTTVNSWVWAEGLGEVSRDIDYSQSSDQGTTGVTRITIRALTALGAVNPISVPSGTVLISIGSVAQDGYLLWTGVYAKGTGIVVQTTETREGGNLIIYRRIELNSSAAYTPATPSPTISGTVTLISRTLENSDGFYTYRSEWAEGNGEVSRAIDYGQSIDPGVTGVTRTTIRYLTALGDSQTPALLAGSVLVSRTYTEQDGYGVWLTVWAKGVGTVISEVEQKEAGKLVLYHVVSLGTAPATPAATIGGVVILIDAGVRQADGYVIYDRRYAEGLGEISRTFNVLATSNPLISFNALAPQQTNGLVTCTIRYLTAGTAMFTMADPTTGPTDFFRIENSVEARDGYALWTSLYAQGDGVVVDQVEEREGGKLILYRKVGVNTEPPTPSPSIGGTVALIDYTITNEGNYHKYESRWAEGQGEISREIDYSQSINQGTAGVTKTVIRYLVAIGATVQPTSLAGSVEVGRTFTEQDGYRIWTTTWAKGTGTVDTDVQYRSGGKLVLYRTVSLTLPPATPAATIGGTVILVSAENRVDSGYTIYDYRWAEGYGVAEEESVLRDDGLMERHRTVLTVGTALFTIANGAAFDSAWSPDSDGILFRIDSQFQDGYTVTRGVWMYASDGTSAPTSGTVVTEAWIPFTYPGRARIYQKSFTTGAVAYTLLDVFLSPPTTGLVLGTKTITYQASNAVGALASALWNPTDYATLFSQFVNASGNSQSIVKGFEGYGAVPAGTSTFTCGGASGTLSVLGQPILTGTSGIMALSGGPASPGGSTDYTLHAEVEVEPTFVKYDGTKYYRKIVITATPAAQAALPV